MEGTVNKNVFAGIVTAVANFFSGFVRGDFITKLSYIIMGSGCFLRGQVVKGLIFLGIQTVYVYYMISSGIYYISMLPTLGVSTQEKVWDEAKQIYIMQQGDNSMLILLFGVVAIIISVVVLCIYVWQTRIARENETVIKQGGKLRGFKGDLSDLLDKNFSSTILAVPLLLAFLFTVMPLIFMVLMAFTNFNKEHQPPGKLFTWIGFSNFSSVFGGNPLWSTTFFKLLVWTMIWAFFATFINYILGMLLAIHINKKNIKGKAFFRTIFVTTIAVPQFVTLMLMSKLLSEPGALNVLLQQLHITNEAVKFLANPMLAKITVIVVNVWVGIPYSMLITSGVLLNIPDDIYEASRLDGATPRQQFFYITLPYMLHITAPYLITQFVGNINNFNVIYLLTGGGPASLNLYQGGETDLLVTWLYKLTVLEKNYALASTIGIIIFVIVSVLSLIVYNNIGAVKKEDELS